MKEGLKRVKKKLWYTGRTSSDKDRHSQGSLVCGSSPADHVPSTVHVCLSYEHRTILQKCRWASVQRHAAAAKRASWVNMTMT